MPGHGADDELTTIDEAHDREVGQGSGTRGLRYGLECLERIGAGCEAVRPSRERSQCGRAGFDGR